MIITRTPYRISLFGGGTDYPTWYREHGGAVLGMTINKYCYITLRELPPFFAHKYRVAYSIVEEVNDIAKIAHPAIRAVLAEKPTDCGLEIHHDGDLPARSGLGSSSSFTAGLLNALYAFEGRLISKRALALETIRVEQDVMHEAVGSQDQVWAAYGGLNRINFETSGGFEVRSLVLPVSRRTELEDRLMLFFTGVSRFSTEIAKKKIDNLSRRTAQLNEMRAMVDRAEALLTDPDMSLDDFGKLLHQNWMLKRELADGVTTPEVEAIYDRAIAAGAHGGKLLGAGGGGFILFFVDPDARASVRKALEHLVYVPVKISYGGSEVILYQPENDDIHTAKAIAAGSRAR